MKIKYQSTMHADGRYPPVICRVQCRCYWMMQMPICIKINSYARNIISFQLSFNSLKKLYYLPEDFHWHDLCHVYAMLMVHCQVNIKEQAVVLGYSSGIFTMQH